MPLLAGRPWELERVNFEKGVGVGTPARAGRGPSRLALPGMLSREVCVAMRDVLVRPGEEAAWLASAAEAELAARRATVAGNLGLKGKAVTFDEPRRAVAGLGRVKRREVAEALAPQLAGGP